MKMLSFLSSVFLAMACLLLPVQSVVAAAPSFPGFKALPKSNQAKQASPASSPKPFKPVSERNAKPLDSVALFKKTGPSVVVIVSQQGFGAGVIIDSNTILTNYHVVESTKNPVVVFKPAGTNYAPRESEGISSTVIKTDRVSDLALLRVPKIPSQAYSISLGTPADVEVGSEVHAIGHPKGGFWTYTKGIVSQIRKNFQWSGGGSVNHKADVIQTQTPLNMGNSGGPLFSVTGKLVGINSFKIDGDGLNFAVSISSILRFLQPSQQGYVLPQQAPSQQKGNMVLLYEGRDSANAGVITEYDSEGQGRVTLAFFTPDDKRQPSLCYMDVNGDGIPDTVVYDTNHDDKWDYSLHDTNFDGFPDREGIHPDGRFVPSGYRPYSGGKGIAASQPQPAKQPAASAAQPASLAPAKKAPPAPRARTQGKPTVNCANAVAEVDKAICADSELLKMDMSMSGLVTDVIALGKSPASVVMQGQEKWMTARNAECKGNAISSCLQRKYKARIVFLESLLE